MPGMNKARAASLLAVVAFLLALLVSPAAAQASGTLDSSFGAGGKVVTPIGGSVDEGTAVALQDDGRIVVAGYSESGTGRRFAVGRYNSDGSLDPGFDGDGKVTTAIGPGSRDEAYDVALQPDGKIVVAGDSYDAAGKSHFAIVRYNPDGSLDTSFDGDGKVTTTIAGDRAFARAVAVQGDGRIVVAGNSSFSTGGGGFVALARYHPDGSLDASFNDDETSCNSCSANTPSGTVVTTVGSNSAADAVAIQGDGRIVVTGRTLGFNTDIVVLRYTPDGGLDGSFGPVGTTRPGTVITDIGLQTGGPASHDIATSLDLANGRIVVAGFTQSSSGTQIAVTRYLGDGALDSTFNGDGIVTTAVGSLSQGFGVKLDPEGRTVVAGEGTASSSRDFAVVRYGTDGALDSTFGTGGVTTTPFGTGIDGGRGLVLQPDGGIVVAGVTDSGVGASQDFALARYHGDPPPPPPTHTLTVATEGTGAGAITSTPAGIDCGTDCTETYPAETVVELTATAAQGSAFAGWSGACNGTGACIVDLSADRDVTATFDLIPAPTVLSTMPADGALDVPPESIVSATFDMPLDTFTLTLTSSKGRDVSGTTTCDSPCTTVTFTPTRALAGRTTYTASVTGTAESGTTSLTWSFTTGRKGGKPG